MLPSRCLLSVRHGRRGSASLSGPHGQRDGTVERGAKAEACGSLFGDHFVRRRWVSVFRLSHHRLAHSRPVGVATGAL